jgi:hypothetical protein
LQLESEKRLRISEEQKDQEILRKYMKMQRRDSVRLIKQPKELSEKKFMNIEKELSFRYYKAAKEWQA